MHAAIMTPLIATTPNISVFELFSIGIGPSSSHTIGPMRAARQFIESLTVHLPTVEKLHITLYGSLAFTGRGHGTPKAIVMGLEGEKPERIDPDSIPARMASIYQTRQLQLLGKHAITFDPELDLQMNFKETLPGHSNAMRFKAYDTAGNLLAEKIYYSIGGGFILSEDEIKKPNERSVKAPIPYPFFKAEDLLSLCKKNKLSIKELMLANEKTWRDEETIRKQLHLIADTMQACIQKGCETPGILEGGLQVQRRAPALYQQLLQKGSSLEYHDVMTWLNVFAMAVNEENAAGGRVVTAPTNGAAGIVPAVLAYYRRFCPGANEEGVVEYLLTAAAIGMLYKMNASISGAEMGCQGEVGVACSMAAGGLAAVLGGTIDQIENAAEMAMEHNLGLTCDPVNGLVQIPCIERNAMGTVKAVNAAHLALAENDPNKVSLDMVINTMREIGNNMNSMYKETSQGGLAVNVPDC
ncbi:MAG TPA: L-serine ammonia-lyase [Coxiellaceae bacterium]|nr:L-serine ammonia-lyase [Coxiellaceae bacterium]